jgi:hypothetical protein
MNVDQAKLFTDRGGPSGGIDRGPHTLGLPGDGFPLALPRAHFLRQDRAMGGDKKRCSVRSALPGIRARARGCLEIHRGSGLLRVRTEGCSRVGTAVDLKANSRFRVRADDG